MNDLKYVILTFTAMPNHKTAVLFNGMYNHCDFLPKEATCESAGFCVIESGFPLMTVKVYGNSSSLKVKSKPEDAEIIEDTLARNILFI